MPQVLRGYVPRGEFRIQTNGGLTIAQWQAASQGNKLLSSPVNSQLNYRKVWAFFWSNTHTILQADIVATLQGVEQYRHPFARYASGSSTSWYAGWSATATIASEAIVHAIPGGATYVIAPWRFNLSVDGFHIDLIRGEAAAAVWDGLLAIQSWIGV